jgi:hypothetical protein
MRSLHFRVWGLSRLTVLVGLFLFRPALMFAQFTGPYDLTPPIAGSYTLSSLTPSVLTLGTWTAHRVVGPSFIISTSATADSLGLYVGGSLVPGAGWISTRAAASGVVTFHYTADGVGDGAVNWFNSGPVDQGPAGPLTGGFHDTTVEPISASFAVNEGDYFGFSVYGAQQVGINFPGQRTFTIDNFSAPVPEPSPVAIFIAATIFGSLVMLRKKRAPQSR